MADGKRRFQVEDIFSHKALSAPTASPDGRRVVFVATQSDLKGNKVLSELWAWEEGPGAWQVTFGGKAARPLFSRAATGSPFSPTAPAARSSRSS